MRAVVFCGVAVALLFVATDAIRTVQGDGISRTSRRITTTDRNVLNKTEDNMPTYRSRGIRRREETHESSTARSLSRGIRGRTVDKEYGLTKPETQVQSGQNTSFESKKSINRSRSRTIGKEATTEKNLSRESIIRGRSRGSGRKFTSSSSSSIDQPESSSNTLSVTLLPHSVETKADITQKNDIIPTEVTPSNQFRRRSSTVSTVENTKLSRPRGRINTRTNSRALDLDVAGTTNTFTAAAKETTKISDGRHSRKLRFHSRTSETDTNLTGDGVTNINELHKSSQRNDTARQSESESSTQKVTEKFQPSTKSVLTSSTQRSMKVVKRPFTRSNGYFKSSELKLNSKMSDEISEDDNYPESFKALIQAKNATQSNSSIDESLSVKATHQVIKTHALPLQSNTTDPATDNNSRLRKKLLNEEKLEKVLPEDLSISSTTTSTTSESPKQRSIPFRPRGTHLSRSRKSNTTKSTTENITKPSQDSQNQYKFNKRIKSSTGPSKTDMTLKTKRVESTSKKQVVRSSLFSRKNDPVGKNISVIPLSEDRKHDRVQSGSNLKARRTLPSTTYYSRLRNNTKLYLPETIYVEKNTETPIADKKVENSADMPLIFTYLSNPGKQTKPQRTNDNNATVVSTEPQENSTENEIVNKGEESENKLIINTDATTQKYHANYKENVQSEKTITSATPVIRNIKTRKYARKQDKTKDRGATTAPVIFKSKERNARKHGDIPFSKTTEIPANSISQEPEKPKHKFSSKYRGSYIDRPFYKPTVPTVTPSTTAWDKFFVTDEYTQFIEEPILFGNDYFNNTMEIMSRMNFTSPTYTHESSIELVEGEEIQLGPDMNAIAFTKTRRPLSSADLRLSESLTKPLQVLNVETSQHSPSVTVSIFDALAEILTSTSKPRISTTPKILPKITNDINIVHSLDGVSSNVNVNTVTGFASQETVTSKDNLNTNAKFVQTTEKFVFNSLLVGDNVTPSLNAEDDKTSLITSPKTVPIPPPTTPIFARKPFAIKILYSEPESTTAMPSTSATSTHKSTMVYNSISDLLLSNNGLVSSGLTSMLSNNIRSIIDSMDDESKSRLSVGMTNLLNTLTPNAINNDPKVDDSTLYMTTPYSLEDIKDTENIDINLNDSSNIYNNILQNVSVTEKNVNSTETLLNSQNEVAAEGVSLVNRSQSLENVQNLELTSDTDISFENILVTTSKETESTTVDSIVTNNNLIDNLNEAFTNKEPVTSSTDPFSDITTETSKTQLQSPSVSELLSFNQLDNIEGLEDPTQISQLQLWILSKKARVLKMIEDLLRKHSEEISDPPFDVPNLITPKISFSNRLTEIINTMSSTTIEPDFPQQTTFNFVEGDSNSTPTVPFTTSLSLENNLQYVDSVITTQNGNDFTLKNDESSTEAIGRIADSFTTANSVLTTTTSENIPTTPNSEEEQDEKLDLVPTTTKFYGTTTEKSEPRLFFDTTTETNLDETSTSGIESTKATVITESKSEDFITTSNILNVATRPSIPKKDFVIFGILPNNTVIPTSALNIKDSSSLGITTTSTQPPAEKSTASHVLSLRTTTMLPSIDEILLNSISLATKEEMVISSMTSSTPEPRILTLDIDPETKQIRTEKPNDGNGNTVFKYIPIEDVTVPYSQETNVLKLALPKTTRAPMSSTTEVYTQTPQLQINTESNTVPTSTIEPSVGTSFESNSEKENLEPPTPVFMNEIEPTTESQKFTFTDFTNDRTTFSFEQTTVANTNTNNNEFTTTAPTTFSVPTATSIPIGSATNIVFKTESNILPVPNDRNPKNIPGFNIAQNQQEQNAKLLQALLMATGQSKNSNNDNIKTQTPTTTARSIEDDIRQFEEDTKLLKALLQATGRDPASLNLPSLDDIKAELTTLKPRFKTTTKQSQIIQHTTAQTTKVMTTTASTIDKNINRLQDDTKLLQALLQATENKNVGDMPVISGLTSNVRIASNPLTTSMESKSTTSFNVRPVYTSTQTPLSTTVRSQIIALSTLQPTTEDIGISTTFRPANLRPQYTTTNRPTVTTEVPSSSTYSDEEDLLFLKNLKSVLSTKSNNEDPETSLANRVIALAVERSLNEIQVGKSVGTTKVITTTTPRPTTTPIPTTTTIRTTTTRATTTPSQNIESIEDDIKQFEQDTKLLQALLKATGQDPSKFNIPTLPTTTKPATKTTQKSISATVPYGIEIAVKDDLKNEQDDAKLLQTLIKLQDAQETTTMRSKLAITGHSSDEALKKLIQKTQPAGMVSASTKPSMSLSTEFGNSNDALLAALLKEQGFGPTTALLNQVVVTPKARRTTTLPPPPPAPRRPILDGLAWLWQQWRDTAPGSQSPRQSRPAPTRNQPVQSASTTSSRVNWFGSGPFVGNADERPANRIPLEPPSAVEQPPGRGQLVSAAINVSRAFSQFLGAAIQGAAQTVQNVFRAGQKVASNA